MVWDHCSIADCKNDWRTEAEEPGVSLSFFSFPTDPELAQSWSQLCEDNFVSSTSSPAKVCSSHFSDEDFEDALQARLLGTLPKKLKRNAIPSLNLNRASRKLVPQLKLKHEKIEERRRLIEDLLTQHDEAKRIKETLLKISDLEKRNTILLNENKLKEKELRVLQRKYDKAISAIVDLKTGLMELETGKLGLSIL